MSGLLFPCIVYILYAKQAYSLQDFLTEAPGLFLCFLWDRLCVLRRTIEPGNGLRSCSSFVTQVRKQPFKREEGGPPLTNEGGRGFSQTPPPLSTPLLVPGYAGTHTRTHSHMSALMKVSRIAKQFWIVTKKQERTIISFIRKNI